MVNALIVMEAMPTSRNERRSPSTSPSSHPKVKGFSASDWPRIWRTSSTSPPQLCRSRNSSTAVANSLEFCRGSRIQTTLRAGSAAIISPAVPSLKRRITGAAGLAVPIRRNKDAQRTFSARADSPASFAHAAMAAGDGTVSPERAR